jgi:hypothetical protein
MVATVMLLRIENAALNATSSVASGFQLSWQFAGRHAVPSSFPHIGTRRAFRERPAWRLEAARAVARRADGSRACTAARVGGRRRR